jgi:hypothetical protein
MADDRRARTLFKHTLLDILALPKIDERLDKRETADNLLAQRTKLRARLSLQPSHMHKSQPRGMRTTEKGGEGGRTHPCDAQRRTPLGLGIGLHEVPQALDLGEVEPATLVRAARELSRSGRATTRYVRERSEHSADDGAPAVHVQL